MDRKIHDLIHAIATAEKHLEIAREIIDEMAKSRPKYSDFNYGKGETDGHEKPSKRRTEEGVSRDGGSFTYHKE